SRATERVVEHAVAIHIVADEIGLQLGDLIHAGEQQGLGIHGCSDRRDLAGSHIGNTAVDSIGLAIPSATDVQPLCKGRSPVAVVVNECGWHMASVASCLDHIKGAEMTESVAGTAFEANCPHVR